jgi:hypothetical protein
MSNAQAEELPLDSPEEFPEETCDFHPLPPKQEAALRALLKYPTVKEAALAAGISEPTLWRYRRDPAFARRLEEAHRELHFRAQQRIHHAADDAAKVLHDIALDAKAPHASRIAAARSLIDHSRRSIELDALGARLDELERHILRKQEQDALDQAEEEEEGLR